MRRARWPWSTLIWLSTSALKRLTSEGQSVLSIQPFTELGSTVELIKSFGGRTQYLGALQVLERELYRSCLNILIGNLFVFVSPNQS